MMLCPICKTQAENAARPDFDGIAVQCKEHGEFEVTGTVQAILAEASSEQWADALAKAKRVTPAGQRPRIDSYKL
jgi:hypothetical protein